MSVNITKSKVCAVSLISDCLLAAAKLVFGSVYNSSALTADGVHSCADSVTSFVTLLGTLPYKNKSRKKKAEKLTLLFIVSVLLITGFLMLSEAAVGLVKKTPCEVLPVKVSAVSAAAFIIKELLFRFSMYASEKLSSKVLYAQAWHHRSDALSCVGSFIGIAASGLGFSFADKAACILISIMIIKTAFDIFAENKKTA